MLIFLTDVTWDTCAIIIDKKVKISEVSKDSFYWFYVRLCLDRIKRRELNKGLKGVS